LEAPWRTNAQVAQSIAQRSIGTTTKISLSTQSWTIAWSFTHRSEIPPISLEEKSAHRCRQSPGMMRSVGTRYGGQAVESEAFFGWIEPVFQPVLKPFY
jgi:hypothetical protein